MDLLIIAGQVLLACYVLLKLRRLLVRKRMAAGKASQPPQFYDTAGRAGRYRNSMDVAPMRRGDADRKRSRFDGTRLDHGAQVYDSPYSGSSCGSSPSSSSFGGGGDAGGGGCE